MRPVALDRSAYFTNQCPIIEAFLTMSLTYDYPKLEIASVVEVSLQPGAVVMAVALWRHVHPSLLHRRHRQAGGTQFLP